MAGSVHGRMGQRGRGGRAGHEDRTSECRNQERGLPSNLTVERQERVLGAAEGEYDCTDVRGSLMKLFPGSIICQGKRPLPGRRSQPVADRKQGDRNRNRFLKHRDVRTGWCTVHEAEAYEDEDEDYSDEEHVRWRL